MDQSCDKQFSVYLNKCDWCYYRCVIYVLGIIILLISSVYFPIFVKQPPNWTFHFNVSFILGYFLLVSNFISTLLRRKEYVKIDKGDKEAYKEQVDRIRFIQEYGSVVLTAASVTTAILTINGLHANTMPIVLVYLGASIISATFSSVPIWVSEDEHEPLNILRHFKTMTLILAATWLSVAIVTIVQNNI